MDSKQHQEHILLWEILIKSAIINKAMNKDYQICLRCEANKVLLKVCSTVPKIFSKTCYLCQLEFCF